MYEFVKCHKLPYFGILKMFWNPLVIQLEATGLLRAPRGVKYYKLKPFFINLLLGLVMFINHSKALHNL